METICFSSSFYSKNDFNIKYSWIKCLFLPFYHFFMQNYNIYDKNKLFYGKKYIFGCYGNQQKVHP